MSNASRHVSNISSVFVSTIWQTINREGQKVTLGIWMKIWTEQDNENIMNKVGKYSLATGHQKSLSTSYTVHYELL